MVRKNIPVNENSKDLSTIGGRIFAERGRVGMTLVDFALLCGVTKQTQIKYESNENHPDTRYLERAMHRGIDVMYVLTGERDAAAMSAEYQNLIEAYEAATDDLKRAAFAVLLSPWRKGYLDKPIKEPGYFQHQILGEDDVRFEAHYTATRSGNNDQTPANESALSPDEQALLDNYRSLTPDKKTTLDKISAALEKQIDDDGEKCA